MLKEKGKKAVLCEMERVLWCPRSWLVQNYPNWRSPSNQELRVLPSERHLLRTDFKPRRERVRARDGSRGDLMTFPSTRVFFFLLRTSVSERMCRSRRRCASTCTGLSCEFESLSYWRITLINVACVLLQFFFLMHCFWVVCLIVCLDPLFAAIQILSLNHLNVINYSAV